MLQGFARRLGDCITFVAGSRHREYLLPLLRNKGYSVRVPLEGLGIGVQLSRLTQINSSDNHENDLDEFYPVG